MFGIWRGRKAWQDAYVAAGYLGSGDVATKAEELLRNPDVAARFLVVANATAATLDEFAPSFPALERAAADRP